MGNTGLNVIAIPFLAMVVMLSGCTRSDPVSTNTKTTIEARATILTATPTLAPTIAITVTPTPLAFEERESGVKLIFGEEAVCNNGERATYLLHMDDEPSDKWVVYLEGGGYAGDPDGYRSRVRDGGYFVKPMRDPNHYAAGAFGHHMKELGYNIVFVHYCSSDLYQGDHYHEIDGQNVPFKGRRIVEGVINDLTSEFNMASDIIFAGFSAGAVGLGFNADLFARFENSRVLSDSLWYDARNRDFELFEKGGVGRMANPKAYEFIFKNMPGHCASELKNCLADRQLFKKLGIDKIFVIWNLGDPSNRQINDKTGVAEGIRAELTALGAGFSADMDKVNIEGFRGGHVMTQKTESYNQRVEGITIKELVDNWVKGLGNTLYIGY